MKWLILYIPNFYNNDIMVPNIYFRVLLSFLVFQSMKDFNGGLMALPKVKVMVSNSKLTLQETIVYFMNYIFSNHDVQQSVHNIGSYHVAMHNLSCDFHITVMSANVHLSRSHYQSSLELALYPGPRSEHGKGLVTLGRFSHMC